MSAKQAGRLLTQRRFLPLFTLFQAGTFNDNTLKNALIALITFGGFAFLSDLPSAIRVPGAYGGAIGFFLADEKCRIAAMVDRERTDYRQCANERISICYSFSGYSDWAWRFKIRYAFYLSPAAGYGGNRLASGRNDAARAGAKT